MNRVTPVATEDLFPEEVRTWARMVRGLDWAGVHAQLLWDPGEEEGFLLQLTPKTSPGQSLLVDVEILNGSFWVWRPMSDGRLKRKFFPAPKRRRQAYKSVVAHLLPEGKKLMDVETALRFRKITRPQLAPPTLWERILRWLGL